jgi:hypothetical protein
MNEGAPKPKTSVPEVEQTKSYKSPSQIALEAISEALNNPEKEVTRTEEEMQVDDLRKLLDQPDPIQKIKDYLGIKGDKN